MNVNILGYAGSAVLITLVILVWMYKREKQKFVNFQNETYLTGSLSEAYIALVKAFLKQNSYKKKRLGLFKSHFLSQYVQLAGHCQERMLSELQRQKIFEPVFDWSRYNTRTKSVQILAQYEEIAEFFLDKNPAIKFELGYPTEAHKQFQSIIKAFGVKTLELFIDKILAIIRDRDLKALDHFLVQYNEFEEKYNEVIFIPDCNELLICFMEKHPEKIKQLIKNEIHRVGGIKDAKERHASYFELANLSLFKITYQAIQHSLVEEDEKLVRWNSDNSLEQLLRITKNPDESRELVKRFFNNSLANRWMNRLNLNLVTV